MRLVLTVIVPVFFTVLLVSGCSKENQVVAPTNFSAQPGDSAEKNKVTSPKLPKPNGGK